MEVTLHVRTEQVSFRLAEEQPRALFHALPLTALTIRDFTAFTIDVRSMRENGQTLLSSGSRITLQNNPAQTGALPLSSATLHLLELPLASGASARLATDSQHRLIMVLQSTPEQLALTIQGPLRLTTSEVAVQDAQHNVLLASATHHLEVRLPAQTLLLTQAAPQPWNLTLDVTQQRRGAAAHPWPFSLVSGLKVAQIDFQHEKDHKLVSAIKHLWIVPLITEDKAYGPVSLQLPGQQEFTFQAMALTDEGLECTFFGDTNRLNVGDDAPRHNVLPSWLGYLVNHQVIQGLSKLLGK